MSRNGELRIQTREQRLHWAQALVRKYIPANVSLVDELIQERRQEAERRLQHGKPFFMTFADEVALARSS